MSQIRWHWLAHAVFLLVSAGALGSTLLSTSNLAKLVFTSSSRPMILSSPGAPVVMVASLIALVLWFIMFRRRAAVSVGLSAALVATWTLFGYAVALDGVEGRVWSGPFPFAVCENAVWKPGDHETWVLVRSCGVAHICLSVASGPETVVYAGPMARQVSKELNR